ncbi:MAG: hypothetical protein MUQ56_02410, partial [Thermoleophilia bacterium]|nr:hypothetical protein [Thermoleophilia bacterium]
RISSIMASNSSSPTGLLKSTMVELNTGNSLMITLFTHAIYEDAVALPDEGFLHPALFTDDLDAELEGHTVVWGPAIVEGAFGTRRIAFVEAPGGIRLEFMEQLAPPPAGHPTTPGADA